jgi:hypothetical protein
VKASKSTARITKIEMVWKTCKEEVESEIRRLLHEQNQESTTAEWFRYRTTAAKTVYDQMDEQQKHRIAELIQEYKDKGNEPDIRQR